MCLSSGCPGSSRRWIPSRPAIIIAENPRYGVQVGSGKRTSIRLALGGGESIGFRTEGERLRLEYARLIGASKPGTSRRYELVPGLVNAAIDFAWARMPAI